MKAGWQSLAILLLFSRSIETPSQVTTSKAKYVASFRVVSGFILVDATFGKDAKGIFLLDTGSAATALLDREASVSAGLKSKLHDLVRIQGSAPELVETTSWREAKVRQGKVTFVDGDFPTINLKGLSDFLGVSLAGLLGAPVVSNFVVKIDYAAGKLSFFDPKTYHYGGTGVLFPLEPSGETGAFIVKADVVLPTCDTLPMRFYLDSGANRDITFNRHFLEAHPTFGVRELDQRSRGLGEKPLVGKWGDLHSAVIGGLPLATPDVLALGQDSSGALSQLSEGSIGAGIMSQFSIILDKPHGRVIMEPRTDKPPMLVGSCVATRPPL